MRKPQNKATRIRKYMLKHPNAKAKQIAAALGVTEAYVFAVQHKDRVKFKVAHEKHKAIKVWASTQDALAAKREQPVIVTPEKPPVDNVNHPAHYKVGGIETIDFIEAKGLGYNLGNVIKYITRADHKGTHKEDLAKARWYLNREIARVFGGTK